MRMPKLSEDEIQDHLRRLPGWTRDGETLTKQYQFADFIHAMQFVNHVAQDAEAANHHPDIDIRYNKVTLALTTHDSGGLTQNDINLAAEADTDADSVST